MAHLIDPNAPSELALAPTTPRWRRRRWGVLVVMMVMIGLAFSAWHYTHRVSQVPSNTVPVPAQGSR